MTYMGGVPPMPREIGLSILLSVAAGVVGAVYAESWFLSGGSLNWAERLLAFLVAGTVTLFGFGLLFIVFLAADSVLRWR